MTYNFLDIFFAILLLFCIISITIKGFWNEFFSKAAIILGALCAVLFFRVLVPHTNNILGKNIFSEVISFLVVFIGVYIVIKIIQKMTGSLIKNETLTSLDRALGFFLGIIEGIVLIAICLIIIKIQPFFDVEELMNNSFAYRLLSRFIITPEMRLRGFISGQ